MAPTKLAVVQGKAKTELDAAIGEYLDSVDARNLSPRSREYYESTLSKVLRPWAESERISDPRQLDQRALDRLNKHLLNATARTGKALAPASVNTYLRAVRQFVRWAQRRGLVDEKARVQMVRTPKPRLITLTPDEINAMENAATTERDKLIVRVLGDGGLRLGELLALTPADLVEQGRERYLSVTGKGSKGRMVPIKPQTFARLKKYAEKGRPADAWTPRVFISLRRRPSGGYEALDARAVQQMVRALAQRAGIKKAVHPHTFRHSMITNALAKGMNLVILKEIVGHADLNLIANTYAHLDDSERHREMMRISLAGD